LAGHKWGALMGGALINCMLIPAFYLGPLAILGAESMVLLYLWLALVFRQDQVRRYYRKCWGVTHQDGKIIPLFVTGSYHRKLSPEGNRLEVIRGVGEIPLQGDPVGGVSAYPLPVLSGLVVDPFRLN
jgi:hypothetical protein